MKPSDLPRAGVLTLGEQLRVLGAKAIDEALIDAVKGGGTSPKATRLHVLATAIATAVASVRDTTAPTVASRTQPTGVRIVTITYNSQLDPAWVPPASAFATAPVRTITKVEVDNRSVLLHYTGDPLVNANTVAYTQSATEGHRDLAGNLVATHAAAAITVA